ncbi:unnamed protein product, partial [Linum tenue]
GFPGVLPYQLPTASDQIHSILTTTNKIPLIVNWVPTPPIQAQVDSALKVVEAEAPEEEPMTLGAEEFKQWVVVLFADAVAEKAGKALLQRVPIGVAGIVGIGGVQRSCYGTGQIGGSTNQDVKFPKLGFDEIGKRRDAGAVCHVELMVNDVIGGDAMVG